MNWITRCPECATIYKIVPDQLKVASGWLRCGYCQHAFDSTGLVVPWMPDVRLAQDPGDAVSSPRVMIDDLLTREDRSSTAASTDSMSELSAFSDALSSFKPLDLPNPHDVPVPDLPALMSGAGDADHEREAVTICIAQDEDIRLRRVVWGLLLLLSLQSFWVQRHALATFVPAVAPLLRELCHFVACEIEPWRAPEHMLIESSEFAQREGGFTLKWTLRNASVHDLGMTALELKLHDAQGKVLVQRVLWPAEVGAPAVLYAGQDWSGLLQLDVPLDLPVTGYRLLSFYP